MGSGNQVVGNLLEAVGEAGKPLCAVAEEQAMDLVNAEGPDVVGGTSRSDSEIKLQSEVRTRTPVAHDASSTVIS